MKTLILASQSPRRRELLEKAGFVFHTISLEISENLNENLSLDEALMELARRKASAVIESDKLRNFPESLVLSADTVVVLDGQVIGKPSSLEDAKEKLSLLSGRVHQVKTAICFWDSTTQKFHCDLENSKVAFYPLSRDTVEKYVHDCRPLDKAGAYGIQELPPHFLKSVDGPLDNVMGLPMDKVRLIIKKNGWLLNQRST